jgi:hypothetical protein
MILGEATIPTGLNTYPTSLIDGTYIEQRIPLYGVGTPGGDVGIWDDLRRVGSGVPNGTTFNGMVRWVFQGVSFPWV